MENMTWWDRVCIAFFSILMIIWLTSVLFLLAWPIVLLCEGKYDVAAMVGLVDLYMLWILFGHKGNK